MVAGPPGRKGSQWYVCVSSQKEGRVHQAIFSGSAWHSGGGIYVWKIEQLAFGLYSYLSLTCAVNNMICFISNYLIPHLQNGVLLRSV